MTGNPGQRRCQISYTPIAPHFDNTDRVDAFGQKAASVAAFSVRPYHLRLLWRLESWMRNGSRPSWEISNSEFPMANCWAPRAEAIVLPVSTQHHNDDYTARPREVHEVLHHRWSGPTRRGALFLSVSRRFLDLLVSCSSLLNRHSPIW